jgi:RNA polymerase sigma-70 factor (ECF subfamily)
MARASRAGDERAFEGLVDRYQKAIFNLAYRMVDDYEDAKDITQVVFLKAYENLAGFDPSLKFYSWIYRIAINESLNFLRKKDRLEPLDEKSVSAAPGPEERAVGDELSRGVQRALMTLAPDHRTVIVLRHFLDCSYEEISRIAHVPEKTVKSRLFSARQQLKNVLESRGILP